MSGQTITLRYATANNTASAATDYQTTSGTLSFSPGQTSKTLIVPVRGDTIREADETFFVNLSDPIRATIRDARSVCAIVNDD